MKFYTPDSLARAISLTVLILLTILSTSAQAMSKHPAPIRYIQERMSMSLAGHGTTQEDSSYYNTRSMMMWVTDIDAPAHDEFQDYPLLSRSTVRADSGRSNPDGYNNIYDDYSWADSTEMPGEWMLDTYSFETGFTFGFRKRFSRDWTLANSHNVQEIPPTVPVPAALWLFITALGCCALRVHRSQKQLIT